MAQAIEAYRHVSASEEFQEKERMRVRRQHDEASALGHARREGKQEGIQENSIAIAKKMKAKGADINYIIEMTDLTVDDILRL